MRTIKGYLDKWRIQEYLLIAFFISWFSWGILIVLTALGVIKFASPLGIILFGIGGFGPTISALMCIDGKLTFRKVREFILGHKKKTFWYLLVFAILESIIVALSSMEVNPQMPWYVLPIVFFVCTLFGGGNEELGWRGTLQPLLERVVSKRIKNPVLSFIVATLLIGIIWAIWHLPLWFVSGSTQQSIHYGWFLISSIILSFWLGCLYHKSNSILYCMILHGLSNVLMSFFIIKTNWTLVLGFLAITILSITLVGLPKTSSAKMQTDS